MIWTALGLLPKQLVFGVLLAAVTLGGALVQRQCTVTALENRVEALEDERDAAREKLATCNVQKGALASANEELAAACKRQSAAVANYVADSERRMADAQQALREALRARDAERSTVAWLAQMLERGDPASACPAGDSVRVVREGLKR